MYFISFIFIFLLGTVIGSFLNVVIYRLNTGMKIVNSRSICMSCGKTLRWYELIPVFSFLIQSGKCRRCCASISHQYPLVEVITGFIFAFITFHFLPIISFSISLFVLLVVVFVFIFSLLIVISVYDIRHKIIPDNLVYVYALVSFLTIFINQTGVGGMLTIPPVIYFLSGPIFALPFALLWLISKGKWMGLGDAKLMLGIGWMLGPSMGLSATILSFWIGSVLSLMIMFFSKKKVSMKTEIPFAPFLIISTLIVFLFNLDVFNLVSFFHF